MAESEEELKSVLMKVKEESEKVGLKLDTQKTKIMAFGPITSWQIDGETVETVADFSFLGSKITADGDCSHEIKRFLLLGRKVMTNLAAYIEKQRYYFANKGPSSQGYGFSTGHVWMGELDYKLSTEELMLLNCGVGEDSWESLDCKEISPGCSLKGLMLKLKLQYFGRLMQSWLIWKDPHAGKD